MKPQVTFVDFVLKQWLVIASGVGLVLTSLYTQHFPNYSTAEWEVVFILLVLLITVNGMQQSGLLRHVAHHLEQGTSVPLKLVLATFFSSMLLTNDVALVLLVPLTLSLNVKRKDILVILEALAANAGSASAPTGNPQNLYIYWSYGVSLSTFIRTIAPLSILFLVLLSIFASLLHVRTTPQQFEPSRIDKKVYAYGALFLVTLLTVIRVLPLYTGFAVLGFAVVFDRKSLRVDYALLLSFLFFFGIADNLRTILSSRMAHSGHIFLFSALASQIMSNVPATLLFAKFTSNWQALLWGSNAGGFGSLFASFANLIAYKLYVTQQDAKHIPGFTATFLALGYAALLLSVGLYFLIYRSHVLL